jgi:hypothetical protein
LNQKGAENVAVRVNVLWPPVFMDTQKSLRNSKRGEAISRNDCRAIRAVHESSPDDP